MECQFLYSANRLMIVYICTKFHENILKSIKVMERTPKAKGWTDRRTSRQTDGRKAQHNTTRLRRAYKKTNQYEKSFVLENMKS